MTYMTLSLFPDLAEPPHASVYDHRGVRVRVTPVNDATYVNVYLRADDLETVAVWAESLANQLLACAAALRVEAHETADAT